MSKGLLPHCFIAAGHLYRTNTCCMRKLALESTFCDLDSSLGQSKRKRSLRGREAAEASERSARRFKWDVSRGSYRTVISRLGTPCFLMRASWTQGELHVFLISLHAASCSNVFILHMTSSCAWAQRGGRHDVMEGGLSYSLSLSLPQHAHTHTRSRTFCASKGLKSLQNVLDLIFQKEGLNPLCCLLGRPCSFLFFLGQNLKMKSFVFLGCLFRHFCRSTPPDIFITFLFWFYLFFKIIWAF